MYLPNIEKIRELARTTPKGLEPEANVLAFLVINLATELVGEGFTSIIFLALHHGNLWIDFVGRENKMKYAFTLAIREKLPLAYDLCCGTLGKIYAERN